MNKSNRNGRRLLKLSKETVKSMNADALVKVHGGAASETLCVGCNDKTANCTALCAAQPVSGSLVYPVYPRPISYPRPIYKLSI